MARILFTLPRFHTNMWFAVRQIRKDGHEVRLLVNNASKSEDYLHTTPKVLGNYPSRAEVNDAVTEFNPDLVILRNAWALSRRAARAARQHSIPALRYDLLAVEDAPNFFRRLKLFHKGMPRRRITPVRRSGDSSYQDPFANFLPWPVGRLSEKTVPRAPGERLRVLLVGKLSLSRKNQLALVAALEAIDAGKWLTLTLVGTTPKADAPHVADVKALLDRPWVRLAESRPFREMADLYIRHDVCILPSFDEPLGASPVEAMAYGVVPFISTQCGSAGYLTSGTDGIVFDPNQLSVAAEALVRLAQSENELASLRLGVAKTVESCLSEEVFSRRFSGLLDTELNRS